MRVFNDLHGNLNDDLAANAPQNLRNLFVINKNVSCVNKKIRSISIPRNVDTISYLGFSDCTNLKTLVFDNEEQ